MLKLVLFASTFVALLLLVCLTPAEPQAQEPAVPVYDLHAGGEIPLANLPAAGTFDPIKCDSRGNIYLRFYQPQIFSSPLREFTPDGDAGPMFSPDKVAGWEGAEFLDFAITDRGAVYLLADQLTHDKKIRSGILGFNKDGDSEFASDLKLPMESYSHLQVFSTGDILLTGYDKLPEPDQQIPGTPSPKSKPAAPKPPPAKPRVFIIDRFGEIEKEIVLKGPGDGSSSDSKSSLHLTARDINISQSVCDPDGNIYTMVPAEKPIIYVISHEGEVVRSFYVDPPSGKSVALGLSLASDGELLLKTAVRKDEHSYAANQMTISRINRETGERIADYKLNAEVGPVTACSVAPHSFLFLANTNGKLVIRKVSTR